MMGAEDRHGEPLPLPGADAALHRLAMTAREELAALGQKFKAKLGRLTGR